MAKIGKKFIWESCIFSIGYLLFNNIERQYSLMSVVFLFHFIINTTFIIYFNISYYFSFRDGKMVIARS